jgi:NCAIR mutase (PurE)-related protein
MNLDRLRVLFEQVKHGEVEVEKAIQSLRHLPFEDLGFSKVDHHRQLRQGFPEVIFCEGKTVNQVKEISERILTANHLLLATRATPEIYEALVALDPSAHFNQLGRTITIGRSARWHPGRIRWHL